MSIRARRLIGNAPGRFYVDDQCIYCDLCVTIAPSVFHEVKSQGWAIVFHQPSTKEEYELSRQAAEACPTDSIGMDGDADSPVLAPKESEKQPMPEEETFRKLYRAIKRAGIADVRLFLANGGSPNFMNKNGWSLLMASARYGQSSIATELLDAGADINAANRFGATALALAAGSGHVKMVKLLLARGACADIRPYGWSLTGYVEITSRSKAVMEALAGQIPNISYLPFENPG